MGEAHRERLPIVGNIERVGLRGRVVGADMHTPVPDGQDEMTVGVDPVTHGV